MMKHLFISFAVVSFAGCGITEMAEETRNLTAEANDGVSHGNQLQEQMLVLQVSMLEYMTKTDALMRELNEMSGDSLDKMNKTLEYMRLQSVGAGLEGLLNPTNTADLDPPTRMLPYAQSLAQDMVEKELVEFAYILLQDALFSTGSRTARKISLYQMATVAAFLPLEKLKTILVHQVDEGGQYEETMYGLLMARYLMIRDLLLLPYIEKAAILNVATLRDAVAQYLALVHIGSLSYVAKVKLVIPDLFLNESVSSSEIRTLGSRAHVAFTAKLSPADKLKPEVQTMMAALIH